MKTTFVLFATTALTTVLAVPVHPDPLTILNNQDPTIWAQSTVPVLKKEINDLYRVNVELWNNRAIFDEPHSDCSVPIPPGTYEAPSVCQKGDLFASTAIRVLLASWKLLAQAMFPVAFGNPDTAGEPRASFSDFSHFYNHLLLEVQVLQNITAYYICNGNIHNGSQVWNAGNEVYFDNQDLNTIVLGPTYTNSAGQTVTGENGTYLAYPSDGHFVNSIHLNSARAETGWGNLKVLLAQTDATYVRDRCLDFQQHGIPKPVTPRNLP